MSNCRYLIIGTPSTAELGGITIVNVHFVYIVNGKIRNAQGSQCSWF